MLEGSAAKNADDDVPVKTVLVVDDDADCRYIYSEALRNAGFRVLLAADGVEAVAITRATTPDIVLLDVAMPRMDGRDAVRLIKGDPSTKTIPTIAVTAADALHRRGDLEEAGFDAVLLKPVLPQVVVIAVRQALEARG
jgi:CheY-like chemotaxis protein